MEAPIRLSVKKKKKEKKHHSVISISAGSACFRDIKPRLFPPLPLIRAGGMLSLTGDGHVSSGGKCYRFHD